MSEASYAIGDLARQTGTTVETIRWYERDGTMPAPARTEGGRRLYTQAHLDRLKFIRHARELGFPLGDVRALLQLTDKPESSCAEADMIARGHLGAVRSRIARLKALEAELERMLDVCEHGKVAECRVIQVLANHSHEHCVAAGHGGTGL